MAGFDEFSTRLEHMKSAHEALGDNPEVPKVLDLGGKVGSIEKSATLFAAQLMMLVRSALLIQDMAEKPMTDFVLDSDNQLSGLYKNVRSRFAYAITRCGPYFQETLKAMVETGEDTEDSGLAGKVRLLGEAPELLREKALTCSDFTSPGFSAMLATATRVSHSGGLRALKDVRVQYRSQDGLALFR